MAIEVITPAVDNYLTSVDKLKLILGISDNSQDSLLEEMIKQASDLIETYTGRVFAEEEVVESLPGKGTPDILLSRTPIINVTSVKFDTTETPGWVILDKDAGIIQRRDGWLNTNLSWATISPHESSYYENRWHFTYTGGYKLPSAGAQRNLPYDLERACIEISKTYHEQAQMDGTLESYKIGDTSVKWAKRSASGSGGEFSSIPNIALNVLDYYRRAF